jgi:hypothetical protein
MKPGSILKPPVLEVFVDYGLVGFAVEFPVALTESERKRIDVGSTLLIIGDGVDDRIAEVVSIEEDPWVLVRLSHPHER